jgi:hypothetical protein
MKKITLIISVVCAIAMNLTAAEVKLPPNIERLLATLPKAPKYTADDYGPLPENFEALATQYISSRLKDPYSAHIRLSGKPHTIPLLRSDWKYLPTWSVSLMVNAKNGFGGYIGEKLFVVYLYKGRAIDSIDTQ